MSLATKLEELRRKKGESLQQIADAVGVSKAHIWQLERGDSANPGIELLTRLAKHFSVTVAFLISEEVAIQTPAALQFFREFEGKLSDADWETLKMLADRLKGPKS